MKKYVVLLIAITISAFSFAQKTELKGAEKALKSNNFASAKTLPCIAMGIFASQAIDTELNAIGFRTRVDVAKWFTCPADLFF